MARIRGQRTAPPAGHLIHCWGTRALRTLVAASREVSSAARSHTAEGTPELDGTPSPHPCACRWTCARASRLRVRLHRGCGRPRPARRHGRGACVGKPRPWRLCHVVAPLDQRRAERRRRRARSSPLGQPRSHDRLLPRRRAGDQARARRRGAHTLARCRDTGDRGPRRDARAGRDLRDREPRFRRRGWLGDPRRNRHRLRHRRARDPRATHTSQRQALPPHPGDRRRHRRSAPPRHLVLTRRGCRLDRRGRDLPGRGGGTPAPRCHTSPRLRGPRRRAVGVREPRRCRAVHRGSRARAAGSRPCLS